MLEMKFGLDLLHTAEAEEGGPGQTVFALKFGSNVLHPPAAEVEEKEPPTQTDAEERFGALLAEAAAKEHGKKVGDAAWLWGTHAVLCLATNMLQQHRAEVEQCAAGSTGAEAFF